MRKIVILVVVAAVLVAGGAYYGLEIYPQQRMRAELDQNLAKLLPGYTVTYRDAHYSPLSRVAVIGGVAVHSPEGGAAAQKFDVTIDEIQVTSPSLGLGDDWNRADADPGAVTPDTMLPVADRIAVKGLAFHGTTASASLASASVDKLRLYPWSLLRPGMPPLREFPAYLSAMPQRQPPLLADFVPLLQMEAEVLLAIGCDGYVEENVQAKIGVPAMPNTPAMELSYAIAKISGGSLDRGVFKEAAMEGIKVGGAPFGTFTADRFAMGEMDFRAPATRLLAGDAVSPAMLDGLKLGRFEYGGMSLNPAAGTPIVIGTVAISNIVFSQGIPVSMALSWSGAHVSARQIPIPQVIDAFDKLGLDSATLSFGFAYDWDLVQKRLTVHDTMVKVDVLGTLALGMEIADVIPGLAAQTQASLVHLRLRYDDASLADRALKAGAAQGGVDPEAFRQQLTAILTQQSAILGNSAQASAATQAVVAFLKAPKSLTIELSPPSPLGLATLQNAALLAPDKAVSSLGLTVTANQ